MRGFLVVALVGLVLLVPAQAGFLETAYCRLWPHTEACKPAPVPLPPPKKPVVEKPEAAPKAQPKPVKAVKPKAKKPIKRVAKPKDDGPDLPWPCWQIRLNALGKTDAQLRQEGRARGIKLTPKQERQAKACLGR